MLSVSPNSAGKSIMPEFDNEGNLTSIENNYGVKTINTYDGSLIIKKQITNLAGLTTYNEYEYCFPKMYRWNLSEYMESTPVEKVKEKWDELEKSIIMNFADDISISIRDDLIEMVIVKNI